MLRAAVRLPSELESAAKAESVEFFGRVKLRATMRPWFFSTLNHFRPPHFVQTGSNSFLAPRRLFACYGNKMIVG